MLAGVVVMIASTVVKGFFNYDLGRNATIVIELASGWLSAWPHKPLGARTRNLNGRPDSRRRWRNATGCRVRYTTAQIQILALMSRRGREIGGETAELAELAGEQERRYGG